MIILFGILGTMVTTILCFGIYVGVTNNDLGRTIVCSVFAVLFGIVTFLIFISNGEGGGSHR
jgi:hypothetical protein